MKVRLREEIEEQFKWKISDIYESDEAFEKALQKYKKDSEKVLEYKGKLADEEILLSFMKYKEKQSGIMADLMQYAHMKKDENANNTKAVDMAMRVDFIANEASTLSAFVMPEISKFSNEKLKDIIANKKFQKYSRYFEEILRDKKLILSEKEEKLIREFGLCLEGYQDTFSMFDNVDAKFKTIKDENGNDVEISHATYSRMLQNKNRKVREDAFNSMFIEYKEHINMIASNYAGSLRGDWVMSKIRGFKSTLECAMYNEEVSPECYETLIESLSANLAPMHEYIALRKKALNLDEIHFYDLYVPITNESRKEYDYETAKNTVLKMTEILGDDYNKQINDAFNSGWIDVYENKGKRSGAYSWGNYNSHPFVLLNFEGTTHDIFTIAHELGHSMHSFYSNKKQPLFKSHYVIFLAEIASTVNEVLLLKHLLKTAEGEERKFILSYYLDMFRTTIYRQTMFSEFEVFAHKLVENGEAVTAEVLSEYYNQLNRKYYGEDIVLDDLIKFEWARIPHFYEAYYVYKYATGLTAAVNIANRIINEGESYVKKYKEFLSMGSAMPPLEILKIVDIDLTDKKTYDYANNEFKNTLEELKKLI